MNPRYAEPRDVSARVLVQGTLELTAPCHLGGESADASSDRPLVRAGDGRPYLPGTTLTGLLRGALQMLNKGTAPLFGACWGDPDGVQSRLIVDDAPVVSIGPVPTELRDGVAVDVACGTAAEHKKFDYEVLPVGTRFALRFELLLPGDATKHGGLQGALLTALRLLEDARIALGARTRRGLGTTRIVTTNGNAWTVTRFDVGTKNGMLSWIASGLAEAGSGWPGATATMHRDAPALAQAWGITLSVPELRHALRVRLPLAVDGTVIIRSGGHDPDEPDATHLARYESRADGPAAWRPVLTGTSLGGVLRHRCVRIARTLAGDNPTLLRQADDIVTTMFGPAEVRRGKAWASRVCVPEVPIEAGTTLRHTRLRIDPWIGGAVESLLFTEDLQYGGTVDLVVTLREPLSPEGQGERTRAERALLLLALRDLGSGDLHVGGEAAGGRGRLCPRDGDMLAKVEQPVPATIILRRDENGMYDGAATMEPANAFDQDFAALKAAFTGGGA